MTREEALAIYRQGEEFVVFKLMELNAKLTETLEKLTGKEGKYTSTPSGMQPVYSKPSHSGRGRKKPGQKVGHKGEHRESPVRVDKEEVLQFTECPECGEALRDSGNTRERCVEDIPDTKPEVTRFVIHRSYCPKCKKMVEPKVTAALPKAKIGTRALTLTAWLHYGLGQTISHILEVLKVQLQFRLSPGGLTQMWKRLGEALSGWYEAIEEEARKSSFLHADETGWRVNGKPSWLWCFTNPRVTCYMIDRSRGFPALSRFFKEVFEGILITDFWRAYGRITQHRQTCLVHLFRELGKVSERNISEEWQSFKKKLVRLLRDAMRLDKSEDVPIETKERRKERLHGRLDDLVGREYQDADCRRLRKRLEEHREHLLTFLDYEGVSADNNRAEREIRPAVIMRKNSFQNKSKDGAVVQAVLMSIYRTLKLRGHNPLSTIVQAIAHYVQYGELPPLPEPITSHG